jgi:hypothetical protein
MITLGVLLALIGASCAADFEVGGDAGWVVPPAGQAGTYNEWASKNRFLLGDSVRKTRSIPPLTASIIDSIVNNNAIVRA